MTRRGIRSTIAEDERVDLYPSEERNPGLRVEIDRFNQVIYANINNGAYKAGFGQPAGLELPSKNISQLYKTWRKRWLSTAAIPHGGQFNRG